MLGSLALFSSGCILDIEGSDFDDDHDHHGPHQPVPSQCDLERNNCLLQAGGNQMFQNTCQEAYRRCIGITSGDESTSSSGGCQDKGPEDTGDCPKPEPSPGTQPKEPEDPKDQAWEDRCNGIEAACIAACDDPIEQTRCKKWGQQCRTTRCGIQPCSTIAVSPQLVECGKGHLGCLEGASTDDERKLCSGSFRVCAKIIPGLEGIAQVSEASVSLCLDDHARCQRVSSASDSQQTCTTMLRACLMPW